MHFTKQNAQGEINLLSLNNSIKHQLYALSLLLLGCSIVGCSGRLNPINHAQPDYTQLPTETVEEIALYIETQVAEGNRTPELSPHESFNIDSPEVQQALRSRAARAHLIQELLDTDHMYENKKGKIAILRSKAYKDSGTGNSRDRDALIVISENVDRTTLYESLQKLNNLNPAARSAIEEIFFNIRKQQLKTGQHYETSEGEVVSKK